LNTKEDVTIQLTKVGVLSLKVTMVIPSYWARESKVNWLEGDNIYDHPTPLDAEGTLLRTIKSIELLNVTDFQLVVIAVATGRDIESQVEQKVSDIVKATSVKTGVRVISFGASHLRQINNLLTDTGKKDYTGLLKLRSYSDVRNMCMFIPHVLNSEVALLIDDDEVFEDPQFISKAMEFIGKKIDGKTVNAIAGYYLQADGDYHIRRSLRPWEKVWGQYAAMNKAFDRFIAIKPRLKEVPFVFGGNMVLHRDLFTVVPFDPNITRGEDIDFLINARMFGFTFFLDNQLSIKHLPPPKTHPSWLQLRQDIHRFIYEKAKIENQKDVENMTKVHVDDLDPYPGCFLKDDLQERIERTCQMLSEEYTNRGDKQGAEQSLNNITFARASAMPKYDPFQHICQTQRQWKELMQYTSKKEVRLHIKEIIEGKQP
jgi:hypothetical protein